MKKHTTIQILFGIVFIIIVIGVFTFGILSFLGLGESKTIDVSESATIQREANRVILSVGVDSESVSAEEAELDNKEISDKIYSFLNGLGLENDYKTESYNVYPNRDWERNEVTGYTVNHMIRIDTEKIDLTGKILDGVVNAGANNVYGLQFTLTEETEKEARVEAYEKATLNARAKADGIANGLGVKITGVKSISDSSFDFYPVYRDFAVAEVGKGTDEIQVASGDVDVTAIVTVSYKFR